MPDIRSMVKNLPIILLLLVGAICLDGPIAQAKGRQGAAPVVAKQNSTNIPTVFSGKGIIDAFDGRGIVINDTFFPLADDVIYRAADQTQLSQSSFRPAKTVAYHLNDKREVDILLLLLADR